MSKALGSTECEHTYYSHFDIDELPFAQSRKRESKRTAYVPNAAYDGNGSVSLWLCPFIYLPFSLSAGRKKKSGKLDGFRSIQRHNIKPMCVHEDDKTQRHDENASESGVQTETMTHSTRTPTESNNKHFVFSS